MPKNVRMFALWTVPKLDSGQRSLVLQLQTTPSEVLVPRWFIALFLLLPLLGGCASNDSNSIAKDISNASALDNAEEPLVDNRVPPNQVFTSTPAVAAPKSSRVREASLDGKALKRSKKVVSRKGKHKHHQIAKRSKKSDTY